MRKILSGLFAWTLVSMLTGCEEQPVREYSMLDRWAEKEVFASRLVDDMETAGGWTVLEGNPRIGYTGENVHDGKQALRARFSLVDSTYILAPEHRTPWGSFGAKQGGWNGFALEFDEPQDWSGYNRIALWAYIHPSKNPSVSFALSLVNGTQPDSILSPARETNLDIPQGRWVQVLWEIDYFRRDSIRRFEISQTPTGFDRSIGEQYVTIDFDELELQKVEPDHYEGWDIPEGEIAFSHAGYRPTDPKIALAAASEADSFVLKNEKGRTVFTGTPSLLTNKDIPFARLDFSDWTKPGTYTIQYGGAASEPFRIGEDVWNRPLQAALNFYRNQRCGDEVPGVHGVCHADVMGFYAGERKPVNGGWHDAGDLSQGTWRTAYGCYALLTALETKALADEALRGEIAWGVDWLLKTRFADGRHMTWSQCRIYTDGERGTFDDIVRPAEYVPWELFLTSAVFSRASALLDPSRKADLEKAAVEDWEAAMKASGWAEASYLEASWGAVSSALLYECKREERFKEAALCFGDLLLRCQEQDFVDGIPYAGYFYSDTRRKELRHYNHEAFCEAPMLAFSALCRLFSDQSTPWREAARLYLDAYLKPGSRISAPFDLLPAGIYRRADMQKPTDLQQYEAGTQINDAYAIRTFPIWKDHVFHGSTNFHLSQAWALASAAALLQDRDAMGLVQEQLEWTLGRNPFSSSLMYGVGYNYAPDFVYCTHNIVGALPVGIDCFQGDAPFWNGTANATSHEIWIEPVSRFVGTLATFLQDESVEVDLREANPFIGTGGDGHTYPGATAPFGMVQLSPDTHNRGWEAASGYRDKDSTLIGFSHTHLSGTGGVDLGDFLFTPFREAVPFSKKDEVAYPGYYSVQTQGIKAELTALPRTGCQRYTFQGEGERKLWVDLRYNIGGTHLDRISFDVVSDRVIEGGRHVVGWAQDRWMFFSAAFSVPFTSCEADGEDRYLLTFPAGTKELTVTVGLSPTDALAARRNRLAEASDGDFDRIRKASEALWKGQLSKITVEGGTSAQRTNFYSALYHTLIAPNLLSDVGQRPFYSTLSLWDTFRSWNPLMVLLNPEMIGDQAESLVRMYGRDGKLPLWALGGVDVDCMIGYHSASVIADAWLRGIRTFDGEKALAAMVASSNLDPASDWYNAYGYVPSDYTPESVSKTLEFCYDDWCIARMAESLGHKDIAAEYDARSLRYRNLFDPSTGFFRGKESDGNWRVPFDPVSGSRDYTEAIAWQYRHFVPHDMRGYTDLMGGPEAVRASLDSLFETTSGQLHDGNITGLVGLYAHGNEPSHGTAWLYSYVGRPSETQRRVRQMLDEMYRPAPDGICGNEDCGQMSAWYVLSALGLYPVCPGSGEFVLGAPLFGKATVSLPNGRRLVITADHPEHPYVKEVCLNGKPVDRQYVTYEEIMQGGELSFRLSGKPCSDRDALPAPYSLSEEPLVSTPYLTGNPRFFDGSFPVELLCRTPDARIHYTLDGTEPTEASALYEGPFSVTEDCVLKARAFKPGCTQSPLLRSHMFPIDYVPAVTVTGLQPGCRYTYHRGMFLRVAQVAASPVVARGVLPSPSIEGATDEDHFGFIFEGYLDVPEEGLWEFAVTSDDGAVLEIDGHLAVNGDGSHANYTATGHIALRKGLHAFRLLYLEDYEGQNLEWAWKSPGSDTFDPIPPDRVRFSEAVD